MNELNDMRDKYSNLSTSEIELMSPVDMLNITYLYNRKKAIIIEKKEKN